MRRVSGPGAPALQAQSAYGCTDLAGRHALPAVEGDGGVFYLVNPDLMMHHPFADETVADLARLAAALAARGTTLIYVPCPPRRWPCPGLCPRPRATHGYDVDIATTVYADLLLRLEEAGVRAVDARRALLDRDGGAPPFFQADPRLTPEGGLRLARAIGAAMAEAPRPADLAPARFASEATGETTVDSETRAMLQRHCLQELPPVRLTASRTVRLDAGGGGVATPFGGSGPAPRAVLIGSDLTALPGTNVAGFLAEAAGLDVLHYAVPGGGAFAAISSYLTSAEFQAGRPLYLIWENPIAYPLAATGDQPLGELIAAAGPDCTVPLPAGPGNTPQSLIADMAGVAPGVPILIDTGAPAAHLRADFTSARAPPQPVHRSPPRSAADRPFLSVHQRALAAGRGAADADARPALRPRPPPLRLPRMIAMRRLLPLLTLLWPFAAPAATLDLAFLPPEIAPQTICAPDDREAPPDDLEVGVSEDDDERRMLLFFLNRDIRNLSATDPAGSFDFLLSLMDWRAELDPEFDPIDLALARIGLYVDAGRLAELTAAGLVDALRQSGARLDNAQKMALAQYYLSGIGVTADRSYAYELIRDAAYGGNVEALMSVTRFALQGDPVPGWEAPLDLTVTLAFGGMLGEMNARCLHPRRTHRPRIPQRRCGDPQSPDAYAWYRFAADLGGGTAAWRVVEFHLGADAIVKDDAVMLQYLQMAAARGFTLNDAQADRLRSAGGVDAATVAAMLGHNFSADTGRTTAVDHTAFPAVGEPRCRGGLGRRALFRLPARRGRIAHRTGLDLHHAGRRNPDPSGPLGGRGDGADLFRRGLAAR